VRKEASSGTYSLARSVSFTEGEIIDLEELPFDERFEHSLFRTKSELDLQSTLFDEKRFESLIPKNPSSEIVCPPEGREAF